MRRTLSVALLAVVIFSTGACGKGDKPPAPTSGAPNATPETGPTSGGTAGGGTPGGNAAADEARQLFATICATCHGPSGGGDGPASESLTPRPQNYTDPAWQAKVTDDEIRKVILEGGQAVGKSAAMPAQTQLKDKPAVVDELVKMIRGFGKK